MIVLVGNDNPHLLLGRMLQLWIHSDKHIDAAAFAVVNGLTSNIMFDNLQHQQLFRNACFQQPLLQLLQ